MCVYMYLYIIALRLGPKASRPASWAVAPRDEGSGGLQSPPLPRRRLRADGLSRPGLTVGRPAAEPSLTPGSCGVVSR